MYLNEIGEFNFLDRIKHKAIIHPDNVIKGIDDDCAVFSTDRNRVIITTTDSLVEGIHFLRDKITAYELGLKSLAVCLSDIAAIGGHPVNALLSLVIPPSITLDYLEEFYRGFYDMALIYNINLVGGDISRSLRDLMVNVTVIGDIARRRALFRNQAQPGDRLYLLGVLGNSAAGMEILMENIQLQNKTNRERLIKAHTQPRPFVFEGEFIAESNCATAMIDISDGLSSDLSHIVEQSYAGANIYEEKLPITDELRQFCEETDQDPRPLLLHGGEEYCLLLTIKQDLADFFVKSFANRFDTTLTEIGEITDSTGINLIKQNGEKVKLKPQGWDHFMGKVHDDITNNQ